MKIAVIPSQDDRGIDPKIFGVGIRARSFSSSSAVTRSMPFLRQESSTALTTIPRTNAGIFFIRSVAAASHAMVVGDSGPYWIAPVSGPFANGPDAEVSCNARRGDPANLPGV